MSGAFVGQYEGLVGSSRKRAVRAWLKIKIMNAHQPPKRGERKNMILSGCYEAIEDENDIFCDCRVDVDVDVIGVGVDVGLT